MEPWLSVSAWLMALGIFALRVCDMTLDTIRVLFVVRGKKSLAWVLGITQSAIFVVAISSVLANLNNPLNIIGYAAGFATGNVIGMTIEERLALGHLQLSIISPKRGAAVSTGLRRSGFGVTEIPAHGKDGTVFVLLVNVFRKDIDKVNQVVQEIDPDAFITAEDVRPVRRGFWRA